MFALFDKSCIDNLDGIVQEQKSDQWLFVYFI